MYIMRMDHLLLIGLVGALRAENSVRRMQQQSLNYRANYSANFQHFSEALCDGAPPTLIVNCFGSSMTILNKSDESITCDPRLVPLTENGTAFECQSSCVDTECLNVYRHKTETFDPLDGPFGSIFFMCEGNTLEEIEAAFVYLGGSTNGTCDPSTSATSKGRNYHIGQLGISCPEGSSRAYIYDDTYVDCYSPYSSTIDLARIDEDMDSFACYNGMKCEGKACSNPFMDFSIRTSVSGFFDTCVESLVDKTPIPTASPMSSPSEFTIRYEASWAIIYDSLDLYSSCVGNQDLVVAMSCDFGGTISYVDSTGIVPDSCSNSSASELLCSINENTTVNKFVSVFYDCVGPQIPTSTVTFPESPAFCENNTDAVDVRHAVTLGLYCEGESSFVYYYGDWAFECTEQQNNFQIIVDQYGTEGSRFACFESVTIPATGSTQNNTKIVPVVAATTDTYWLTAGDGRCFDRVQRTLGPASSTPSESAVTTSQPVAPIPTIATAHPSLSPLYNVSAKPEDASVPYNVAVSMPSTDKSDKSGSGLVIGAVVGGIAAGVLIMTAIGLFVLRRMRETNAIPKENLFDDEPSLTDSTDANGNFRVAPNSASPTPIENLQDESSLSAAIENQLHGESSSSLQFTSLFGSKSDYNVSYKDQSRSITDSQGSIPFAVAVNSSASATTTLWAQAEPINLVHEVLEL